MCFAIEFGMYDVVQKCTQDKYLPDVHSASRAQLDMVTLTTTSKEATFAAWKSLLLGYACQGLESDWASRQSGEIVHIILWLLTKANADPNLPLWTNRMTASTAFHRFLLAALRLVSDIRHVDTISSTDIEGAKRLLEVLKCFRAYGSDVESPLYMQHYQRSRGRIPFLYGDLIPEYFISLPTSSSSQTPSVQGSVSQSSADDPQSSGPPTSTTEERLLIAEILDASGFLKHELERIIENGVGTAPSMPNISTMTAHIRPRLILNIKADGTVISNALQSEEESQRALASIIACSESHEVLDTLYNDCTGPVMALRETLSWMDEHINLGLSNEVFRDPKTEFEDLRHWYLWQWPYRGLVWVHSKSSPSSAYSKVMEAVSRLPPDKNGIKDFVAYCQQNGVYS